MTNLDMYKKIFIECIGVSESDLEELKYQDADWDSIAHMELMAEIEDTFEIELDADDIIDFSSYKEGKAILAKYNIEI